ncbi:MAG: PAS domain-containing protein [Actinomycetota bacterium]
MDTAEARAEAALRRDATLEAVAFAAQRFLQDADWEASVPRVLLRLGEATDVSRVYLFENRPGDPPRTALRAQWVEDESLRRLDVGAELGFEGLDRWVRVLGRGDVVHGRVDEFPLSERGTLIEHAIRSILIAPVLVEGGWWGYVGFDDCRRDRVWTQVEIDALRAAAGTLGAAIERERSDRRLRETEARYRRLVEEVPAISYIDAEDASTQTWTARYLSPQIESVLGYAPETALHDPAFLPSILHPEDRERALAAEAHHRRTGEPMHSEYRLIADDGSAVWFRDQATVLVDAEGTRLSQGVLIDITESKRAEQQLTEAEARYRQIVERTPAITYQEHATKEYSADGSVIYMSPQVEEILGYPAEGWREIPAFWMQVMHPDDLDAVLAEAERTALSGEPYHQEYRMIAADGRVVWFRDEAVLIRDERGDPSIWHGMMVDVTERKEAEEQVREAEARYRDLVENIPAVTYRESLHADPELFYVSPQVEDVFGYRPEQWTWTPGFWLDHIHPDDRERVAAVNQRTNETGEPFSVEYRFRRADGTYAWIQDQATLVGPEEGQRFWQGFMLDVTERRETEAALAEAEARYRALVEQVPVVIYTQAIDPDDPSVTNTIYISPRTEEMLGYTVEETIATGALWRDLLHPDDRERVLSADAAGNETGDDFAMEYRMVRKDGRIVWVHDEATVVRDAEDRLRFWQGFMLDITERKQAEERLERALEVEREATQRLRSLDDMKNTFLQAVSHDLRTPLAAILGLAVTLERADIDLPPDETRDMARRIAANARKLDRMVMDLLDLDRLARGIVAPKLHPTDVSALVTRVVEDSDLLAQGRVAVEADEVVVAVDAAKVERIVENLLANTVRHTPAGTPVWVRVTRTEKGALLLVEDQGPGVPEEMRETIFEPFRQGPDAPEHSPGVGVGLALVRRFAELHGGRAWVEERPGGGASFRVYLPDAAG